MATCIFCGANPARTAGVVLYRLNRTGEPGRWACGKHIKNTDVRPDDDVQEIVDILTKRPSTETRE